MLPGRGISSLSLLPHNLRYLVDGTVPDRRDRCGTRRLQSLATAY